VSLAEPATHVVGFVSEYHLVILAMVGAVFATDEIVEEWRGRPLFHLRFPTCCQWW